MGMYYDGDEYVGDQPSDIPDTSKKKKKKKKNDGGDKNKVTGKQIVDAAGKAFGQIAADRKASMAGYSGGSTDVVDSSKNMTAVRAPSEDILTAAERKRLEKLTGGYG
jgi:hypothetical protein